MFDWAGCGTPVMPPQQTQNICITFVQCWTNVEDVGPTLYKWYTNVLCLLRHDRLQVAGNARFTETTNLGMVNGCHVMAQIYVASFGVPAAASGGEQCIPDRLCHQWESGYYTGLDVPFCFTWPLRHTGRNLRCCQWQYKTLPFHWQVFLWILGILVSDTPDMFLDSLFTPRNRGYLQIILK